VGNLPTLTPYSAPTHSAPAAPTINALSLPTTPDPAAIVGAPSFTYSDATFTAIASTTISTPSTPPSYSGPTGIDSLAGTPAQGTIGDNTSQDSLNEWFSTLAQLIENEEDPELAQQALGRIQAFVASSNSAIQNALGDFQASLESYKGELQQSINQAQIAQQQLIEQARLEEDADKANQMAALQTQIKEYEDKLQYFAQQVSVYGAEVQADVQEWTANELQAKINYYFQEYKNSLELFMAQQQNAMNTYQSDLAGYQAEVQKILQQAQIDLNQLSADAQAQTTVALQNEIQTLQAQVADYRASLERYQMELAGYTKDFEKVLTDYKAGTEAYKAAQERNITMAKNYYEQYQQKLELMVMTNDGATAHRTRS